MPDSTYWVTLSRDSRVLGGGFLLNEFYALTAAHCVLDLWQAGHAQVMLRGAGQDGVVARIVEVLPDFDLALIEVDGLAFDGVNAPDPDRCRARDPWFAPYRPTEGDAYLSGSVVHGGMAYKAASGTIIRALQLHPVEALGDYSGYSGGPIERHVPDADPTLVGLLIEQYPDRQDPDRAAPVVFAAAIAEAFGRFHRFRGMQLFARLLGEDAAATADVLTDPAKHSMAVGDQLLRYIQDRAESGVVDPSVSIQAQAKVLDKVIEEAFR